MVRSQSKQLERAQRLEQLVASAIEDKNCRKIGDIVRVVRETDKTITIKEVISTIEHLKLEKKITTSEPESEQDRLSVPKPILNLKVLNSFRLLIAVTSLTLICAYILPQEMPWNVIRALTGSVFVLFLPGFYLLQFLFPSKIMDTIERLAVSVGISLAIVPLIGLLLNFTPFGVTLNSVIVSMSIFSISLAFGASYKNKKVQESKRQ